MADKVTEICVDIYRKLEKSRVLNIIEGLQIRNILERMRAYKACQIPRSETQNI
jgi:hypothetical protein